MTTQAAPHGNQSASPEHLFRRIGVFQQSNAGDDEALKLAGKFASAAGADEVFCIHARDPHAPAHSDPSLGALEQRVSSTMPADIAQKTRVAVHLGTGVNEILSTAKKEDLDLIIVGKRLPSDELGVGSAFTRLARKAPCSLLVVPEMINPHLSRFLVAVDFSEHARFGLEAAVALAKATGQPNAQVFIQSVYCVSYGYTKTGMSLHQAGQQLEDITLRKLDKFTSGIDFGGLQVERFATCSESPSDAINELATARKMDTIVIGSRGVTSSAVALMGKTTERVLMKATLPVLIVKQKGRHAGFFSTLFSE